MSATDPRTPPVLDAAYRERNQVIAALIRTNGWWACRIPAPDAPGWWIVYAETPEGQVSWHVGSDDFDLFGDVTELGPTPGVPGYLWDGHTTEEKYERLARVGPDKHRALAYSFWVRYRCGYVDCTVVDPHDHGGSVTKTRRCSRHDWERVADVSTCRRCGKSRRV